MSASLKKSSEKKRSKSKKKSSKSSRGSRGKASKGDKPLVDAPSKPSSPQLAPPTPPSVVCQTSAGRSRGSRSPATNIRELRKEAHALTTKRERKANQALAKIAAARLADGGGEDDGLLQVKILEAKGIDGKWLGKADPFTVLTVGKYTFRTRRVHHCEAPFWNQEVRIWVTPNSRDYRIKFSVWDKESVEDDQALGRAELKVRNHVDGLEHDVWLPLKWDTGSEESEKEAESGNVGSLHVVMRYARREDLERKFWAFLHRMYDVDESTTINREELEHLLEGLEVKLGDKDLDEMIQKAEIVDSDDQPLALDESELYQFMTGVLTDEKLAGFKRCPICADKLPRAQAEKLSHVSICFDNFEFGSGDILSHGYLTETQAKQGWFDRVIDRISFGAYALGGEENRNAHVFVRSRRSGALEEEQIEPYVRLSLRLMYQTSSGRLAIRGGPALSLLRWSSVRQGRKYDDPKSRDHIPEFIEHYKIDTSEFVRPVGEYVSFNDFFGRTLKPECRPIANKNDPRHVVSPADCRLLVFRSVEMATRLWIKGNRFTIGSLLADDELGKAFEGGSMMISRLAPQDYHRFHFPVTALLGESKDVSGHLVTVNPIAVRENINVYTENQRVVTILKSDSFGRVAMIAIGATMVGSIHLTSSGKLGECVPKGSEHGYFAFGGSTVITLFQKNSVSWDPDLEYQSKKPMEMRVRMGEHVGVAIRQ